MIDFIITVILVIVVSLIVRKLVLDKLQGAACGSCPSTGKRNCDCA